jgi:hypothetical protein
MTTTKIFLTLFLATLTLTAALSINLTQNTPKIDSLAISSTIVANDNQGDFVVEQTGNKYCSTDNTSNPSVVECFDLVSSFTNPELNWSVMYFSNSLVCQGYGELNDCFINLTE